ncbi:hypothetical protein [Arthrobacter sp. A2-55]|nr:hypothetical protein [Arthrobacter sp. A2-55]MCU6480187.1 hypothetical protein [Arthrobacter sp. A2-55]
MQAPELICIACSGGHRDKNGAYTVCAICELSGATIPSAEHDLLAA